MQHTASDEAVNLGLGDLVVGEGSIVGCQARPVLDQLASKRDQGEGIIVVLDLQDA